MRRFVSLVMALFVLFTATGIAVVWAWERGTSMTERVLLTSIAVVVVLAVHVLPSLIKSRVVWALWMVCLCVAIYSHAGFFSTVTFKAAELRGEQSAQRQAIQTQIDEIKATLATIKARPVAQVSTILSYTKDPGRIAALSLELAEAQRAAKLRDDLVTLSATQTTNITVADAVTDLVTRVSGLSIEAVTLSVNLITALLVELIGVLLWLEVFSVSRAEHAKAHAAEHPPIARPPLHDGNAHPQESVLASSAPAMTAAMTASMAPKDLKLTNEPPTPVALTALPVVTLGGSAMTAEAAEVVRVPPVVKAPLEAPIVTAAPERKAPLTPTRENAEVESVTIKDIDYTNSEVEVLLMQAMLTGECPATIGGIRQYLNCSQSMAVNIERHMSGWIKSMDLASERD